MKCAFLKGVISPGEEQTLQSFKNVFSDCSAAKIQTTQEESGKSVDNLILHDKC